MENIRNSKSDLATIQKAIQAIDEWFHNHTSCSTISHPEGVPTSYGFCINQINVVENLIGVQIYCLYESNINQDYIRGGDLAYFRYNINDNVVYSESEWDKLYDSTD